MDDSTGFGVFSGWRLWIETPRVSIDDLAALGSGGIERDLFTIYERILHANGTAERSIYHPARLTEYSATYGENGRPSSVRFAMLAASRSLA